MAANGSRKTTKVIASSNNIQLRLPGNSFMVVFMVIFMVAIGTQLNETAAARDNKQNGVSAMKALSHFNDSHHERSSAPATSNSISTKSSSSADTTIFEQIEDDGRSFHQKLLLHRRKRYLLFPEGSSFQMVFDLIIPIVDYTNFAIMGITCAVAWELPSKPPSELLQNVQTRLKAGTLGVVRRNDTSSDSHPLQYAADAFYPTKTAPFVKDAYFKKLPIPMVASHYNSAAKLRNYYTKSQFPTSYVHADSFAPNQLSSSFKSNSGTSDSGISSYVNGIGQQAEQYIFDTNWQSVNNFGDTYYSNPLLKRKWPQKPPLNSDTSWWQRNKDRIQQSWQAKKKDWSKHVQPNDYNTNMLANRGKKYYSSNARSGRQRKLLQKSLKHRIYPVFGKKRRRRYTSGTLIYELERIHMQQHLDTRARLFRKIARIYKARSLNGTACVQRALCESGQRHIDDEPQSFILEMLGTIFKLPKQLHGHEAQQVPWIYRATHELSGDCGQLFSECKHGFWQK